MTLAPAFAPNLVRHPASPVPGPVIFSLGIMAWNEEAGIVRTLESLFQQTVFAVLAARHQRCEIICLANGCTDNTVAVAGDFFARMKRTHPYAGTFTARVANLREPGRNHAWNRFVHTYAARETGFIMLMDADIIFRDARTIFNLYATLERNAHADVASGRQHKDIEFKPYPTLRDRISLATSDLTATIAGRFTGQLYCLRAAIARRLYLPRDLGAPDDGFIKAVVCTDFFSHEPDGRKVAIAPHAAHVFEAYVSLSDVLNNQKRQMIGQTIVHVLVEFLKSCAAADRLNLATFLRRLEEEDPDWLRHRLDAHLATRRFFWQLFPGLLSFRFHRLGKLPGWRRLTHLPATLAGFAVTLITCARAFHFLKRGQTYYWPKAPRQPQLAPAAAE